jgi:hypothetical protein
VLDNFNRPDGDLGPNWAGNTWAFSILSNRLVADGASNPAYWNPATFGADQEAYVTISTLDPNLGAFALILKLQGDIWFTDGALAVAYYQDLPRVVVYACTPDVTAYMGEIPVTLASGDQLGARATLDG